MHKALDRNQTVHIGCHDGPFHADEVFAVAALNCIFPDVDVLRTRDPDLLFACDMRVDVGNDYNHYALNYDHHMSWFDVRHKTPPPKQLPDGKSHEFKRGPLRAGFGLIWLHYGVEIVTKTIQSRFRPEILEAFKDMDYVHIQQQIDNSLVAQIDTLDNGEGEEFLLTQSPYRGTDLSRMVANFNPSVIEQQNFEYMAPEVVKSVTLERFMSAVSFAKNIVIKEICSQAEMVYFREKFMKLLSDKDPKNPVLVLDKYFHWHQAYGRAGDLTKGTEMIVFPGSTGWMCQSPRYYFRRDKDVYPPTLKDGTRRTLKHQAPVEVCGLSDQAVEDATGVKGATFIHKGGHLGAAKTLEAAIELAHFFIDKGRQ